MSGPQDDTGTQNEFEAPGTNYPDSGKPETAPRTGAPVPGPSEQGEPDAAPDHRGQDGGRETLTAGQSQHASAGQDEQWLPAMSQNNASDLEKVDGILAQTRSDVGTEPLERIVDVLRQRLAEAGISLPDDDITALAARIAPIAE